MRIPPFSSLGSPPILRRGMLVVLVVLLTMWHGGFFLSGYRLTADDVLSTRIALEGTDAILGWSRWMAENQGRLGFLYLQPVNMVAALMSGFIGWRILFVALYFLGAWLAFAYAARVMSFRVAPLAFLIFLALHPLDFDHLPPTAYPVQNTLPFLILIGCRLVALQRGERGVWMVLGRALQVVAMLATEFALLLGVVMMAAEAFARHPLRLSRVFGWLRTLLGDARFWGDAATLVLVMGPYIAYRMAYPSNYDGNSFDGITNWAALAKATWLHIADGTILNRPEIRYLKAPPLIWLSTILAGTGMYLALRMALRGLVGAKPLGPVAVFLVGAMIFVTVPITAAVKQQKWCEGPGHCAYLDSRTTILGVAILLAVAVAALIHRWQGGEGGTRSHRWVAGVFGVIFAVNSLHNWHIAEKMMRYSAVWAGANTLACMPRLVPNDPAHLHTLIDPERLIHFYDEENSAKFWPIYVESARGWSDCADADVLNRALAQNYLPILTPDVTTKIVGSGAGRFLESGWSALEPWGVWSNSTEAKLVFSPQGLKPGERAELVLGAQMFIDSRITAQRLTVIQNGETLWEGERTARNPAEPVIIPLLPHDPAEETVTLTLMMPDASPPESGNDLRALGIALSALTLRRP